MEYNINTIKNFNNLFWNFNWIYDPEIQSIINILKDYEWRFVGGCVRDSLINKITYDIDINTPLLPDKILQLFKDFNTNTIGRDHGTIMIFLKNFKIEITTLRKDIKTNGRHAIVEFTNDWQQDSDRRDFTINGLMMDYNQIIYDYHNGLQDLNDGLVKFIGHLNERIQEDYLRILRYIRFSIRFDNCMMETLQQLKVLMKGLNNVSIERIFNEINIILNDKNWIKGIKALSFLQLSNIINFPFNDQFHLDFKNFDIEFLQRENMGLLEKYAMIFGTDYSLKNLPIDKNIKNILINCNYDIENLNKNNLFNMYNNQFFTIHIMIIKNTLFYGNQYDWPLNKLKNFLQDPLIKHQYQLKKQQILKFYQKENITIQLKEYLWQLLIIYWIATLQEKDMYDLYENNMFSVFIYIKNADILTDILDNSLIIKLNKFLNDDNIQNQYKKIKKSIKSIKDGDKFFYNLWINY
jgi:tRNA nucleotidyltransferase/poly(A) polymerase